MICYREQRPTVPKGKQRQEVLSHLRDIGSISGLEAVAIYRVSSLTKIISVLKRYGWLIEGHWRRDHLGKLYKRYKLHESQRNREYVHGPPQT
jgi:hypothetical protein